MLAFPKNPQLRDPKAELRQTAGCKSQTVLSRLRWPAVLCAIIPILCYLVIRPYAEMGMDDDWSYVKTAQVLAQTGRIAYNGWGSPMLGWQLYIADLFVKIFGFSFTAVRFSTLIVAEVTAFLLQRTMVRAGINEWKPPWQPWHLFCLPSIFL